MIYTFPTIENCRNETIRLAGNNQYSYYGRLEVCVNNRWKHICSHYMTYTEASVICQELGFSKYGKLALKILRNIYNYIINMLNIE